MKCYQLKNGKTLMIREAEKEDVPWILRHVNKVCTETDNLTFGANEFGISIDQENEFIEAISQSDNRLMLCAFVEDKLIGQLVFTGGARPRLRHAGEFGITVQKAYWGIGVGTGLIHVMVEWAKRTHQIRKINLRVRSDNAAAISLYKKLGFAAEGMITREFLINGMFYDTIHMGQEID